MITVPAGFLESDQLTIQGVPKEVAYSILLGSFLEHFLCMMGQTVNQLHSAMHEYPAGFFESDQLVRGGCLHHLLTGKTDKDVVFGEKNTKQKVRQIFFLGRNEKCTRLNSIVVFG